MSPPIYQALKITLVLVRVELYFITEFCLVPQDDICSEDLTVRENLLFTALLRLPENMSYHKKEALVNNIIKLLKLDHIQNSIVGSVEKRGISGGQRKRVNM
jgi:ABC-type multidrug transport system ATPase subunit